MVYIAVGYLTTQCYGQVPQQASEGYVLREHPCYSSGRRYKRFEIWLLFYLLLFIGYITYNVFSRYSVILFEYCAL